MRLGRLVKSCALALVGLGLCTPVRAESGVPQGMPAVIRRPTVPIPADGAVVLVAFDGTVPIVEVRDSEGTLVPGGLREVGSDGGAVYAWAPTTPLAVGTIEVIIRHEWDLSFEEVTSIDVIEPFAMDAPELRAEPSATWEEMATQQCCSNPLGRLLVDTCFVTERSAYVRVSAGLVSASPQSLLNQYLFTVEPASGSVLSETRAKNVPLEHPDLEAAFYEASDQYCVEVSALNVASLVLHEYTGLELCVARGDREVGEHLAVRVAPDQLEIDSCLVPPDQFEARWCDINEEACADGSKSHCQLYEHVCDDGPLPDAWRGELDDNVRDPDAGGAFDAGEMPTDPIDASMGPGARADGCSVLRAGTRPRFAGSLAGLLVLVLALGYRQIGRNRR